MLTRSRRRRSAMFWLALGLLLANATFGVAGGAAVPGGDGVMPEGRFHHDRVVRAKAKAIYVNPVVTDEWSEFMALVDLIDRTELNAMVIDLKQETIHYRTSIDFFHEAGIVRPIFDVSDAVAILHERGIYAIARIVVFQDSQVAERRPDLAVLDKTTGGLWRDVNGVAWVNAFERELWEANSDLAVEAARLGFDEIQYDYVRFPTDGDLEAMDFGRAYTEEARTEAIAGFLELSRAKLEPLGVKLAADVFGFTLLVDGDLGIGQNVERLAASLDFICPMVYPSHFPNGSLDLPGHPNDFPYETIAISLARGKAKLPGAAGKLRPWLQDFSLPGMSPYGAAELRAQIDAAEAAGVGGWMVWNALNEYSEDAFRPQR